jgi:hypothetical protein
MFVASRFAAHDHYQRETCDCSQAERAAVRRFRSRLRAEFRCKIRLDSGGLRLLTCIRPVPENKMLYQMKVAATCQM